MTPNLFLLGAPRSGTTFLYAALGQHPDIFAPAVKEPHFHLRENWSLEGPEKQAFEEPLSAYLRGEKSRIWGGMMRDAQAYTQLFENGKNLPWRMEGTPNYFAEGKWLAPKLKSLYGDELKFIIALRDPVERARSHHRLFQKNGWETLDFENALAATDDRLAQGWAPIWDYLRYSNYAEPLDAWRDEFGDNVRLIAFDDLTWRPHTIVSSLQSWLGLDPQFDATTARFNNMPKGKIVSSQSAEAAIDRSQRLNLKKQRSIVAQARFDAQTPPLVAIGMPVLNGEASIATAIRSLQAQTYPHIKIIVCDNNSDDQTSEVVADLAKDDPRIILKRFRERAGIRASFKRALDNGKQQPGARYFMFAPCDDHWEPDFISRAVLTLEQNPSASTCVGQIKLYLDDGRTRLSLGVKSISGQAKQRWKQALLHTQDASRLFGVLRLSQLDNLIPDKGPQGWDHYSAAKLALRGDILTLDTIAMHRHRTPNLAYQRQILMQEHKLLGRMFFLRHVSRMISADPEFPTSSLGAQLTLIGYVIKRSYRPRGFVNKNNSRTIKIPSSLHKAMRHLGHNLAWLGTRIPF